KFAATERPRPARRGASRTRHVPAEVKRAVWARDGGRCTFESVSGCRCEAKSDLEYDHIREHARGGVSTGENLRLRCRGHNQHTAERTFGAEFMRQKRRQAQAARAAARARSTVARAPQPATSRG